MIDLMHTVSAPSLPCPSESIYTTAIIIKKRDYPNQKLEKQPIISGAGIRRQTDERV